MQYQSQHASIAQLKKSVRHFRETLAIANEYIIPKTEEYARTMARQGPITTSSNKSKYSDGYNITSLSYIGS